MKGDHEAGAPEERRTGTDDRARYEQPYGSLVELNTERTILDSIGDEYIRDIASEYLAVLGTSQLRSRAFWSPPAQLRLSHSFMRPSIGRV